MHYLPLLLPLLPLLLTPPTLALPQLPQGATIGASAGFLIDTWPNPTCSGPNSSFIPSYGIQVVTDIQSYQLSRNLVLAEQLDFSTYTQNQGALNGVTGACTRFAERTNPDSNGHPLVGGTCYALLTGRANCFEVWNRGKK